MEADLVHARGPLARPSHALDGDRRSAERSTRPRRHPRGDPGLEDPAPVRRAQARGDGQRVLDPGSVAVAVDRRRARAGRRRGGAVPDPGVGQSHAGLARGADRERDDPRCRRLAGDHRVDRQPGALQHLLDRWGDRLRARPGLGPPARSLGRDPRRAHRGVVRARGGRAGRRHRAHTVTAADQSPRWSRPPHGHHRPRGGRRARDRRGGPAARPAGARAPGTGESSPHGSPLTRQAVEMPTIFTRIIEGELPGTFVWRDDVCVAFLSIAPLKTGHTLVVPRAEVDHWIDLDPEVNVHLMRVAQQIATAQQRAFSPERVGLMIAGLEVPHVHLHVVPIDGIHDLDFDNATPSTAEALDDAAAQLRAALRDLEATGVSD